MTTSDGPRLVALIVMELGPSPRTETRSIIAMSTPTRDLGNMNLDQTFHTKLANAMKMDPMLMTIAQSAVVINST